MYGFCLIAVYIIIFLVLMRMMRKKNQKEYIDGLPRQIICILYINHIYYVYNYTLDVYIWVCLKMVYP